MTDMKNFTMTIIGAGVIGTSVGLALKREPSPPYLLIHDQEFELSKTAVSKKAFDKAEWNLINACEQADLILLAIPLDGIYPTLKAIAPYLKNGVVISDTTPNKIVVLAYAQELLPDHAHFIGGNPIVHPMGTGSQQANAHLFRECLYCLTPSSSANEQAIALMVGIVRLLGANPFFMDAAEHDGLVTAVEQLPTILSIALLNSLSGQSSWREMRKMAGGLFQQVSAGANGTPESIQKSCYGSGETLIHWLNRYIEQLNRLRFLLESGAESGEPLLEEIDHAIVERHNWLVDYQKNGFVDPELLSPTVESPSFMKRWLGVGR